VTTKTRHDVSICVGSIVRGGEREKLLVVKTGLRMYQIFLGVGGVVESDTNDFHNTTGHA
jgi:hypothetical protein